MSYTRTDFYEKNFNTDRSDWEKSLLSELKLTEIGNNASKKGIDSYPWPTLSLEAKRSVQLPVQESWKKASQTYVQVDLKTIEMALRDDLECGVRSFFFEKDFLNDESLKKILMALEGFSKKKEVEVFLLGFKQIQIPSTSLRVHDENEFAIGRTAHDHGGSNIQELGLMAYCLIRKLDRPTPLLPVAVFVDPHFFKNIAKIRAAKLLTQKIFRESESQKTSSLIALTSYREWTLYERYSNMLRNDASVASAYIGGADHVQSAGYQSIFELESLLPDAAHTERSLRMARNTSHILALESMLGVVEDAAYGSYHLENLTQHYAEEAWKFMQEILKADQVQAFVKEEVTPIREARMELVKTRKHILAGMNDFPDRSETLSLKQNPLPRFFRVGQEFENLRLHMEKSKHLPKIYVALFGDYATLNGRLNFVKNYFELLGLEVRDPGASQTDLEAFKKDLYSRSEEVLVLCAQDSDYPQLEFPVTAKKLFIAGKFEMKGFKNIYAGQNVFNILQDFVQSWEAK